jgi:hypothetical protein
VLVGTQAPEIERRPARKRLQLLAMTAGAPVVISFKFSNEWLLV